MVTLRNKKTGEVRTWATDNADIVARLVRVGWGLVEAGEEPAAARPSIDDSDILTVGDDRYKEAVALASLLPPIPPPATTDDLTAIRGIGPGIAEALRVQGIDSYAALAGADAEKLADILDGSSEQQVAGWIARARALAGGTR